MPDDSAVMVNAYLFNKKEHYEKMLKETGQDLRKTEVETFVKSIAANADGIYERRKLMVGCGLLYTEHGKFKDLLSETFYSYELGFYRSTISLCGTVAERICYDFIDFATLTLNEKVLDQDAKASLYEMPFRHLVVFLVKLGAFNEKNANLLNEIYNRRNSYVHAKKEGNAANDALWCLNTLSKVLEDLFSMNRFYYLKDGIYHKKPEYGGNAEKAL